MFGIRYYSGVSKNEGRTCIGLFIEKTARELYRNLPNHNTVIQTQNRLNIFTDSQSEIRAIEFKTITSRMILDYRLQEEIDNFSEQHDLYIIYVPGHC